MPPAEHEKFFFVHIMKTGGTSFSQVIADNFANTQRYPISQEGLEIFEHIESYVNVQKFVENVNRSSETLRMIRAHVPLSTRELLSEDYRTITLLREPVERIISYLKHCRRYHIEHQSMSLEAIYEDAWFKSTFMQNYQTKIFSMTAAETQAEDRLEVEGPTMPPRKDIDIKGGLSGDAAQLFELAPGRFCMEFFAPSSGVINVNDSRFEIAKENLRQLDCVGVTPRFDHFLQSLHEKFGWTIRDFPKQHVGEQDDVSQALREKIAADNAYDRELFFYAQSIA